MGLDSEFVAYISYYRKWWRLNDFISVKYKEKYGTEYSGSDFDLDLDILKEFKKIVKKEYNNEYHTGYDGIHKKQFLKDYKKLKKLLKKGYTVAYRGSW